jgi:hypothetical protein
MERDDVERRPTAERSMQSQTSRGGARVGFAYEDDDWFGPQVDADWSDDLPEPAAEEAVPARGAASGARSGADGGGVEATHAPPFRRRRAVALVVALAVLISTVVVLRVVLGGDEPRVVPGGTGSTAQPSPPPPPPPPPAATTEEPPTTTPAEPASPAPTLTVELPSRGLLAVGDRGQEVEQLQKALQALALDPGEPDGIFGQQTKSAVVAFQQANDLEPDGIVGEKTAGALNRALAQGEG